MADLGQAYVQIVPSAKGISGSISSLLKGESTQAGSASGEAMGTSLVGRLKKIIVAAGIGAALTKGITAAVKEGAALEQSLGGVETLFKGHADIVKNYAKSAFKTAGVSANEYMENVTAFSASLIQSTAGNTEKAAQIAHVAMVDMSDNANKMGSDMRDIQNAYQGFAKQNYTMLDNLKLGYGGTKTEMERLLADAQKLTGVKYDINNLGDVMNAIHAIQENIGITGTTALEAATTVSGSFQQMKAAATNLLGNMALGQDVERSMRDLVQSVSTFLFGNLLPMVARVVKSIPSALAGAFGEMGAIFSQKGTELVNRFGEGFGVAHLGDKFKAALAPIGEGVREFTSQIPAFFQGIAEQVRPFVGEVMEVFAELDFSGIQALLSEVIPALGAGISKALSIAAPAVGELIKGFKDLWNAAQPLISSLASALKPVFEVMGSYLGGVFKGVLLGIATLFKGLAVVVKVLTPIVQAVLGVFKALQPLLSKVAEWIGTLVGAFSNLGESGGTLKGALTLVWEGIKAVIEGAKTAIQGAINAITNVFQSLKTAGETLKSGLSTAWEGMKSLISTAAGAIQGAIEKIKGIFTNLSNAGNSLKSAITTAWNGMKTAISTVAGAITNKISSMKGAFESLRRINLASAGRAIMEGFLRGITAVWGTIQSKVSSMAGWIKAHKGPISYDRKLLIPAGRAIMAGLHEGIVGGFEDTQRRVGTMADALARGFETIDATPSVQLVTEMARSSFPPGAWRGSREEVFPGQGSQAYPPLEIHLTMGGKEFRAFVDSISEEQDRTVALHMAY